MTANYMLQRRVLRIHKLRNPALVDVPKAELRRSGQLLRIVAPSTRLLCRVNRGYDKQVVPRFCKSSKSPKSSIG